MSSGSLLIGSENKPLGYVTPPFPGIGLNDNNLYSTGDIYRFTVYWSLIVCTGFHLICGLLAVLTSRKPSHALMVVPFYGLFGAFYGFVCGSVMGLFLSGIYIAGALKMSTWIPFTWALIFIVYQIIQAYKDTSRNI